MENMKFNFNDYGYVESTEFNAKTYEVSISENDKIISVTENGSLLATVKLGLDGETLSLIGKDGTEFSSVEIPLFSSIESAEYDEARQVLVLTIKLSDGTSKVVEISFVDMLDDYAKKEDVEKNTQAIKDEAAIRAEADAKFTEKDNEIEAELGNKVSLSDASTPENPGRKAIVLNNHDTLLGSTTSGGTVNIAMVSKWDKVDLGSAQLPINLNGNAERPTYNDDKELALMDDLTNLATSESVENLEKKVDNKVDWTDISTEENPNRKAIVLNNHDTLLGSTTSGGTVSIAMVSKWGIVDLGTTTLPINLNTPSGVRPTVQEAGQSGEEANKIAYLSDILDLKTSDNLMLSRIETLEEKLASLSKTNVEDVVLTADGSDSFNDNTKDYIISGEESKNTTIVGKSVKMANVKISNNARTDVYANDVELKGVELNGEFPKENGNAVVKINNAEYVVVRDMVFDSSNVYNGIEIGLAVSAKTEDSSTTYTLPKSILFENCKFLGKFSNNAILIFGTQDNAVININNCYFEDLSNPFRLSNRLNVKCTMNITNCKIDKWDVNSPWQGMLLMQDYTSGDADKANENNLFAPEKVTINVINTIGPDGKKVTMPSDISTVCGTGNEKQLFYIWDNYRDLVPYDKSKYPTINIM